MATKEATSVGKVLGLLFTSVVAPILVHVALQDMKVEADDERRSETVAAKRQEPGKRGAPSTPVACRASSPSQESSDASRSNPPPPEMRHVTTEGIGKTPEEGLRQAVRLAMTNAVSAELAGSGWTYRTTAIADLLMQEASSLIRIVQHLGTRKEWRLRGNLYHVQLALELNRSALLARLHAVLHHD